MLHIKDSVAVITGGSGGIGKALAEYWLREGGKVVIADIMEDALATAAAELKKINDNVVSIKCDVTSEEDCSKLAELAIMEFGQINLVVYLDTGNGARDLVSQGQLWLKRLG